MWRGIAGAFATLATLFMVAAGALGWLAWRFDAAGPLTAETVVEIPRGAGTGDIAQRLTEAGVIDSPLVFEAGVRLLGGSMALRAGEYAFPAAVSPRDAMAILQSGQPVLHRITIPEGLTSAEVVALLEAEPRLSGEVAAVPPEGTLLPETYNFNRGDARGALIERMQAAMAETLDALWRERAEGLPFATPEEAVVLASIVEKETGIAAERDVVASVFINRLADGMSLQSDPTVIYALTMGRGPLGRALSRADWETASPYNTYREAGLPPGPIANPGRASLEAVMHPAETDYLYFVADGSGGHAFARTLDEHNRNVAAWRRVRQDDTTPN